MTTLDTDRISTSAPATGSRKVWDWPVRAFHWSLALSFLGAFVTNRLGVKYFGWHLGFGYAVIVLVAFRILWGFFGTKHARFANFLRGPKTVLRYVAATGRGLKTRHAGHNPLGALMVVALLGGLGAQAAFGLFADDEIFNAGPLAALVTKEVSLLLTSLHRKIFYVLAAGVAIHVGAVVLHTFVKGEPIAKAMITGAKPQALVEPHEEIRSSHSFVAVALLAVVTVALAALLHFAPTGAVEVSAY